MRIESLALGTSGGQESFSLEDKSGVGLVSYYGLDQVAVKPKNAVFDLNGVEKSSMSNEFTLGRSVRVSLHKASEEEVTVNYQPDSDLILEGVKDFVSNYNELVDYNVVYAKETGAPSKLLREIHGLMEPYKNELESYGMPVDSEGYMTLNTPLASDAVENGELQEMFKSDSPFVLRLRSKSEAIKINPVEYVDKQVVSYPDTSKPPRGYSYITSFYSGLLFNSYT